MVKGALPDVLFAVKSTINFGLGNPVVVSVGVGVTNMVLVRDGRMMGVTVSVTTTGDFVGSSVNDGVMTGGTIGMGIGLGRLA
jgi:hypothetical protein